MDDEEYVGVVFINAKGELEHSHDNTWPPLGDREKMDRIVEKLQPIPYVLPEEEMLAEASVREDPLLMRHEPGFDFP